MDDFQKRLEKLAADMPRQPGINPAMALSVTILRELEDRHPGFTDAVRGRLEKDAATMEASDEQDARDDAPSVRELLASWIFNDQPSD